MAKTKISEFSSTAGNNTDIDSINISEGCAPSGINNAIRELMAQLKDFQTGAVGDSFNGPVGTTTAAAGAFTTLTASSTATLNTLASSGATLTGGTINGMAIGGTAAAAVSATTLTTSSTVTHNGGTANGVAYLNGSKVLTTGSALTFDGTNLGIGTSSPTEKLNIVGGDVLIGTDSGSAFNGDAFLRIQNSNNAYIGIKAGTAASAGILFGDTDDSFVGGMQYSNTDNALFFSAGNAERLRINSAGNVGIGTSSPSGLLHLAGNTAATTAPSIVLQDTGTTATRLGSLTNDNGDLVLAMTASLTDLRSAITLFDDRNISFTTNATERARIDSSGNLLVGKTTSASTTVGTTIVSDGRVAATVGTAQIYALLANRQNDDGVLVSLRQADTQEGTISVSGTTVSYNGGHLSRWAQTTTPKNDTLVKGTVLSNLDEMNVYTDADGNPVENEQLNKVKVSDVEGDANVAGVFVNWTYDDAHNVDEINMAMTGDMIIRIAQGTTVQRGDLLMSAGDGTAKPQGDDIVRSKTVAKVTSTHVTCTYADGSFCVPCVLMAC